MYRLTQEYIHCGLLYRKLAIPTTPIRFRIRVNTLLAVYFIHSLRSCGDRKLQQMTQCKGCNSLIPDLPRFTIDTILIHVLTKQA